MKTVCKKNLYVMFCILCLFIARRTFSAVSTVYNFRIAETTKSHTATNVKKNYSKTSLTLFEQYRIKYTNERQNYDGGLLTFIHVADSFYVRADAAAAKVRAKNEAINFHFSKIQTDDILLYAGYGLLPHKRIKVTPSILFGFPTHKDLSLIRPQFGIGQIGLGVQLSSSYIYSAEHPNNSIRLAGRNIYFFPRTNKTDMGSFKFSSGDLLDLLIALNIALKRHRFEGGYSVEFSMIPKVSPDFDDTIPKNEYIRHSFYVNYEYGFSIRSIASAVAGAFSYGFDSQPTTFGNRHIFTGWLSWGISF